MKKFLFLTGMLCILFAIPWYGCKKETPAPGTWGANAVIAGWNYRACPICGGFYMNFGNSTIINKNTYYIYHWSQQISDFFEKQHYKVPLFVTVKWSQDTLDPPSLVVSKIALR